MKNKPKSSTAKSFGKRLADIRKAKGITQEELAEKIGSSQRVIAYYESESSHIPANLLIPIAKALKVSVDELVGVKKEVTSSTEHAALWRKLKKTEQLSRKDQQVVFSLIKSLSSKNQKTA